MVTVIILGFVLIAFSWNLIDMLLGGSVADFPKIAITYLFQFLVAIGFTILLNLKAPFRAFEDLGISQGFLSALKLTLIFTSPMLIGYGVFLGLNPEVTWTNIFRGSLMAGFVEELAFRGFLFGLLFRRVRIGFFPAMIFVAVLFGLGHITQGNDLMSTLGVFLITGVGGGLFAWLYVEWDNNLWMPIFTHILMNLYWDLFNVEADSAIGDGTANIFRFASVAIILFLTIRKIRKSGSNISGKLWRVR